MSEQPCKNFAKYQAIQQPRCNCYPCWDLYFMKHPAFVAAVASVAAESGIDQVTRVHGDKLMKMFKRFQTERGLTLGRKL